jgi:hypothetical protein
MKVPHKIYSFILLYLLIDSSKANVWDNLYSQYEDIPLNHYDNLSASYKLREFSRLNLFLDFKYDKKGQRIAFEISSHQQDTEEKDRSSLFYVDFDFENLNIQMSQKNHQSCISKGIPKLLSLDLTDLENLWRFMTYKIGLVNVDHEGYENPLDQSIKSNELFVKYDFNTDALGGLVSKINRDSIPEIDIFMND